MKHFILEVAFMLWSAVSIFGTIGLLVLAANLAGKKDRNIGEILIVILFSLIMFSLYLLLAALRGGSL